MPFELTSRYANWSIPSLGIGKSVTIDLGPQITTRRQNYTNRLRASTNYWALNAKMPRVRRVFSSNASKLEADRNGCNSQETPVTFTATPKKNNPRFLTYRLTVQNLAGENISTNVTASLPQYMKFINSTTKPSLITENQIFWTIKKLAPKGRKSISFLAEAEKEGYFTTKANVHSRSLDGREIAFVNISS